MKKRKKTLIPEKCLVVIACIFWTSSDGWASEWFQLDPLDWDVTFKSDRSQRTSNGETSQDTRFDEAIRLRQSGYSLDPRIATFSMELNPVWTQGNFKYTGRDEELDGRFLNYNAGLSLLHGTQKPVSVNAQASRSSGTNDFSLGSRSEFETENRFLALNWKTSVFPTTVSYSERFLDQSFRSGFSGAVSNREDLLRTLKFNGRSSKMNLSLEYNDFDDRIFNRDYKETRARWFHSARWGKGSHLNSTLIYTDKAGFQNFQNLHVAENAKLQHTDNLYSTYRLEHSSITQILETRRNSAGLGLTHQLYQNLTTRFELSGASSDFDLGKQDEYGSLLDLNYNKKIAWDGKLSAGIGGERRIVDRKATGGLLEVIDESIVVDITGIVVLDLRFINPTTIIVTDVTGFVVFTEGVDYIVVPVANNLTEIQILPGGLINVGDTILVDYRYQSMPSLEYETNSFRYGVTLNFGWISLYHREFRSDQNMISGADGSFLTDRRDATSGIQIRWTHPRIKTTFDMETRSFRSGDFESESFILRQSLFYTMSPKTTLTLSANESFTESEGRETDLLSADLSLHWRPTSELSVTPKVGAWRREEIDISDQRYFTAGVDLRWSVRKLSITASLKHNKWSGTINDSDENRLMFTIIRRSR